MLWPGPRSVYQKLYLAVRFGTHVVLVCDASRVYNLVFMRVDMRDLVTFTRLLDELARSFDLCYA